MNKTAEEAVRISHDGSWLAGRLHIPAGVPQAVTIICHGMMSSMQSEKHTLLARTLADAGLAALRFDFAGRGESPGDFLDLSITRQAAECRSVVALVKGRFGGLPLYLVGSSLGGAVAILLAAEGGVDRLATMAAVGRADLRAGRVVGEEDLAQWRREGVFDFDSVAVGYSLVEDCAQTNLLAAAARVSCPWLLVHGAKDETIPLVDAVELERASRGRARLLILDGADHQFSAVADRVRVVDEITGFLTAPLASFSQQNLDESTPTGIY